MGDPKITMPWEPAVQKKYDTMISKIPIFHREIIRQVVPGKAQQNAQARGAQQIGEGDVVDAFFSEVPLAFYSLMVRLMDEVGLDHAGRDPK